MYFRAAPIGAGGAANAATQAALEASLKNAVANCQSGNKADIDTGMSGNMRSTSLRDMPVAFGR